LTSFLTPAYTLAVKLGRREFVVTLVLGLLVSRRRASAQASAKLPRVGWLSGQKAVAFPTLKAFLEGLQEMAYVPGQNFRLEARAPERPDKNEQYADLAAQLVAAGVDVILASTPSAIEATTKATKTIPIVGVDLESDPVAKGWAASLTHPGHNFTGFVLDIPEMSGKQLQFLKEVKPDLRRVAVLGDPRVNELQLRATEVFQELQFAQLVRSYDAGCGFAPVEGLIFMPLRVAHDGEPYRLWPNAAAGAARSLVGRLGRVHRRGSRGPDLGGTPD